MKNPTITLKDKKVLADGKPIGEFNPDDLNKNIVFFFNESHNHPLMPHGWFFLNLVDTTEHAQEVAKGGEGKAPIIFFPGTLGRAPNFPTVWKKKFYHPGIIAAVQGQFRGGTKLHIEYMNVRPSYRRNKIMDKLITFLEEHFEPKAKEFHELTKDGKAFVKGTKRNPYPADNELPDDFKANVPDWNFKLNVKGVSDDFYAPVELEVMNGFLFGHIEGNDGELYPYELGNVAVMLVKNLKYLPVKHSTSGRMKGYVHNVDAIVREIIEKGMKQEGYRPKKNPRYDKKALAEGTTHELEHTSNLKVAAKIAKDHLNEDPEYYDKLSTADIGSNPIKPNKTQVEWAHSSNEGIAFYDIDPLEFLRLTAESPEHFHRLLKEAKPMEFYNSPEVQKELIVHPFIAVDDQGKIDAHEGRHRAASTYNAGEKTYRIAVVAEERGWPVKTHGWRWKRRLKVPPQLIAQYPGMDRYTHQVDPAKLEEIPTYYQVDKEDDVRTTRKKKNPVKLPKLEFEEIE